ncbi:MAG: endonuclease/exonuclease/phosphatase family protein [Acidimicrobiales bacterium]
MDHELNRGVRVATWNLWWRNGDWRARQHTIGQVLTDLAPDIVALQEVCSSDPDQPAWLREDLGFSVATAPDVDEDHGLVNAVATRWPISASGWEYLDVGDLPPHRSVLWCEVEAPVGPIDVYCTHLSHGFDQSALRQRQVAQVLRLVAERRGDPETAFPPLLLGDLNAVPDSDEIRRLTGLSPSPADGLVFSDAWNHAGAGAGVTYSETNPHVNDSAWPERRLDYVLVGWPRPRPRGNPATAQLFGVDPVEGMVGSDHYGVVVDLHA